MVALVDLASSGCILLTGLLAGVATYEFIGARNTGGASAIGRP
jgi:hypothetical protein